MEKYQRLAIVLAAIGGASIAAYVASQPTQYTLDMEAVLAESPDMAPMIAKLCPNCTVERTHVWVDAEQWCQNLGGEWRLFGPGKGGDDPCPIDPMAAQILAPYGRDPQWAQKMKELIDRNDDEEIKAWAGERLKGKLDGS